METCVDTGATFSLLVDKFYKEHSGQLPPLRPPQVYLTGAGGASLAYRGVIMSEVEVQGGRRSQLYRVGRLERLDLLLGMGCLSSYGAAIDCATRTIRIGARDVGFGKAMTVHSKDLIRLTKTVRIRPRGVQRVMCRVEDSTRVVREVLVEGTAKLSDELFAVPSLEISREDGSLPLTLENRSTSFGRSGLGMVVAKHTMLSER
jgi:hypothetical protein